MTRELVVVAVGDLHLGRPNPYSMLEHVAPPLQQADFTLGNLEGPASDRGEPLAEKAMYHSVAIRMPPQAAEAVKRAGFHAVGLANNHGMDFGPDALLQTIELLDRQGIAHTGGGRSLAEARQPAIVEREGVRLALLSYTSVYTPVGFPAGDGSPGVTCIRVNTSYQIPPTLPYAPGVWPRSVTAVVPEDRAMVLEDVRRAREVADIVVVSWHWGLSGSAAGRSMGVPHEQAPTFVLDYQEEMGRAVIDAGASLVMGHHPHRLQGMERYEGGLICYSLGNLAFSFRLAHFGPESCIVRGYVDPQRKQFTRFSLLPVRMTRDTYEPRLCAVGEAQDIVDYLRLLSKKYGTRFEVKGDEVAVLPE